MDNVREVRIDVSVSDKSGNPVSGLERRNFRLFEDGVEQTVTKVGVNRKPLAVVILVERGSGAVYDVLEAVEPAVGLVDSFRSDDWVALVPFDDHPEIAVDFTHDQNQIVEALRRLQSIPSYGVALYDSVHYVLGRMTELEEKRAIVLFGSGFDTASSRRTYGDALKKAESGDTVVYTVAVGQPAQTLWLPQRDSYSDPDFSEFRLRDAANALASFADVSGGLSFEPIFPGQFRQVYETVNADLRNQYTVTFVSANAKTGGKLRKLRVEVINADIDHDEKPDKLKVRHKKGYY
jgi:VWFA-related protein